VGVEFLFWDDMQREDAGQLGLVCQDGVEGALAAVPYYKGHRCSDGHRGGSV
jgi:hypothetical protein